MRLKAINNNAYGGALTLGRIGLSKTHKNLQPGRGISDRLSIQALALHLTCLCLPNPDKGLPGKSPKASIRAIYHPSVSCRSDTTLGVIVHSLLVRLLEPGVHLVLDPVVVEPPVDGGGLDTADR